jgi:rRNA maturation RNase YbeY
MIIHIINRHYFCKIHAVKIKTALGFFLGQAVPGCNWKELSLMLTDDRGIRKVKRQFFDIDEVTDVISFFLHPQPTDGNRQTAEIVINMEQACREGKKRRGLEHEFALYLAHGCDHLAGHDDRTAAAREKMRRRELRWLGEASKLNLLKGLFAPARKSNP